MQFIDLRAQQVRIRENIESRIRAVLDHGQYVMGPEVRALEERLGSYVGAEHAIGCGSGTDALILALMAYGVGPGDILLTTPFTFIATAEMISLLGATPAFVDIDPVTFNIDPSKLDLAVRAAKGNDPGMYPLPRLPNGQRTTDNGQLSAKGIIAVDLFGLPADYEPIKAVAGAHDLFVIQDAAQSFGAHYRGERACAQGDVGCTSFFPAKPLGCYGDGGMCFTGDEALAAAMVSLRNHGQGTDKYDNVRIGINGRLDTLQAAVLLAKFELFPEEIQLRGQVARRYEELLSPLASNGALITPQTPSEMTSVWAQYSVLARDEAHRAAIQNRLKEAGVPTAIYYPRPLHLQPAFASLGYREGDFPVSEDCAARIFSLPMHPYLKAEDQESIVGIIRSSV